MVYKSEGQVLQRMGIILNLRQFQIRISAFVLELGSRVMGCGRIRPANVSVPVSGENGQLKSGHQEGNSSPLLTGTEVGREDCDAIKLPH